jgi:hypothetical protein
MGRNTVAGVRLGLVVDEFYRTGVRGVTWR